MSNAELLADARGEAVEDVLRRFTAAEIERAPKFSKHIPALRTADLESSGVEGDLAWVRLRNGRTFFSPITHPSLRRQYPYVADVLPAAVNEDTFLAAIDVVQRYITDFAWPPAGLVPEDGRANIIELGAYLGHKTIRFAEELSGSGGKVLAVEMMPDNCTILRRNIEANGFGDVIDVIPVGVWNEHSVKIGYSKGRQRNSIVPIDKLEDGERIEIRTETLDWIIDTWGVKPVDLVFVTVNGVEVEAIEGFSPSSHEVRAFFIAAPYLDKSRTTNATKCRDILAKHGYTLMDVGNPNRVVARLG